MKKGMGISLAALIIFALRTGLAETESPEHLLPTAITSQARCLASLENLQIPQISPRDMDFSSWLKFQEEASEAFLARNINPDLKDRVEVKNEGSHESPPEAVPGTIIAAVSSHYWYDWTRDSTLVVRWLMQKYVSGTPEQKPIFKKFIEDFFQKSRLQQLLDAPGGIGEPKYNVDVTVIAQKQATPQKDGPATRIGLLADWVEILAKEGVSKDELRRLYYGDLNNQLRPNEEIQNFIHNQWLKNDLSNTDTVFDKTHLVKTDLDYLMKEWTGPTADVWEERFRHSHFYTTMSYRWAFRKAQKLAEFFEDHELSEKIWGHIHRVEGVLNEHWYAHQNQINVDLESDPLAQDKRSYNPHVNGLDISVGLAADSFGLSDGFYDITDKRVLATMQKMIAWAREAFEVNHGQLAPLMPRYEGDEWNGHKRNGRNGAHPWVIATVVAAKVHYALAMRALTDGRLVVEPESFDFYKEFLPQDLFHRKTGRFEVNKSHRYYHTMIDLLLARGDAFMERVQQYVGPVGQLYEQSSKVILGQGEGPENLSWSHLLVLRAVEEREILVKEMLRSCPRCSLDGYNLD